MKQHKPQGRTGIIAASLAIAACTSIASGQTIPVPAARAIDGDSIAIEIRLKGVDAFELDAICADQTNRCTQCGKAAQNLLAGLLAQGQRSGTIAVTFSNNSSYNRIVGTATSNGTDLGETMIAAGYAVPMHQYLKDDPNRSRRYQAAYEKALTSKNGAFGGTWINPSEWRQGARLKCEAGQ